MDGPTLGHYFALCWRKWKEVVMDVHFGPLLGTMLDETEEAMDEPTLGHYLAPCWVKLEEPVMDLHLPLLGTNA
jgi:hypothetical protein